jgi:hypothetical protein
MHDPLARAIAGLFVFGGMAAFGWRFTLGLLIGLLLMQIAFRVKYGYWFTG